MQGVIDTQVHEPESEKSMYSEADSKQPLPQRIAVFLLHWGVEIHGITPTSVANRTDKRLYQMFFVWFSANFNIFAFSAGSAGPAVFNLGVRDTILILLVVDIISLAIPAFFTIFGPKLGTRAMVQARFSWGYYGSLVPSILNVLSMLGYAIINCIVGGQTLAGVSHNMGDAAAITVISVLSFVVTIFGYRVLHLYESLAWIPNAIAFVVMLGVGGKHLHPSSFPSYPAPTASTIFSFGAFVGAGNIAWSILAPDYGVHHDSRASSFRIFTYSYLGLFIGSLLGQLAGALFAAAAPAVPAWQSGFQNGSNVGGLISVVLGPAGGFGKFLVVLISLTVPSAASLSMYTFGTSFMAIAPIFARVPRYVFALVSEAIVIPVAIVGVKQFYTTLVDVVDFIGYWSAAFAAIILCEHFVFRRGNFLMYNVEDWDKPRRLPLGAAAVLAFIGSFGIIVPSMSQVWYTGPIAGAGTGDIGLLTGFAVSGVLYLMLRTLEIRWTKWEAPRFGLVQ